MTNGSDPASSAAEPAGWIGFEQLQFGASSVGAVLMVNTDAGYAFTDHFAASIGLPVIFTRSPLSPVVNHDYYWTALLGEPYLDVRYKGSYHGVEICQLPLRGAG